MSTKLRRGVDDRDVEEPLLGGDAGGAAWGKRPAPAPRRSRLRRAALVLGGVVAVAVVALLVVQSQMRRIATAAIASTAMTIERMELTRPQGDALTLSARLDVDSRSLFPARLAATNFTIVYNDTRVGEFDAPAMDVAHGHNAQLFQNTTLRIANHSAWDAFARDLMVSKALAYDIRGNVSLSVSLIGGLIRLSASDIPLQKTMSSEGMDGLKRMEIVDIVMDKSTQTQVLATIKTCLFNPSSVSIQPVGRICMEAHYPMPSGSSHVAHLMTVGEASINVTRDDTSHPYCATKNNKNMSHGYNLLELEGEMLGTNPVAISGLISKFLSNTPAEMAVIACTPRATSVDIFNNAMMGLRIPAVLPPRKEPLVGRMFFKGITLDSPEKDHENEFIGLNTSVAVEASSPLGPLSALQLKNIDMTVGLYASLDDSKDERLLGTLTTRQVRIIDGRLVQVSNISVSCDAKLGFESEGKAFGAFVRESVKKRKVQLHLRGRLNVVAQGALGTLNLEGLPMDVSSELNGMDDLQLVSIDKFSLPGEAATPHGEVLTTKISLWNPSLFAVSIGNVQMDMGLVGSEDHLGQLGGLMNLGVGGNKLDLKGRIEPQVDAQGRVSAGVADFFSRYLRGEGSRVVVTISAVEHANCVWMSEALIGLMIETSFPGVQAGFELISGLEMRELDVAMDVAHNTTGSNTLMRVRTDLTATLKMPSSIAIPLNIANVSVALTLQDIDHHNMGILKSGREQCEYKQYPSGYFRLNMAKYYPIEFPDVTAAASMATFVADMLTKSGNVTMRITATNVPGAEQGAFPDVDTRMGMLPLVGVPIAGAPQIPGMNSFRDPPVKILSIDILEGATDSMTMDMSFEITNPSIVKTALGKLVLNVFSSQARMGEATVENFVLDCCGKRSILRGKFKFHPAADDMQIATKFLSNFVTGYFTDGKPQNIVIGGSKDSTPLDVLQPALVALRIPSLLPTLPDFFPETPSLVSSSMLYLPSILHLNQMPTSLKLQNPFSENITVTGVDLMLYPCEKQRSENNSLVCDSYYTVPLARFAPEQFERIFIPAKSTGCYSCCQGAQCKTLPLCPQAATVGKCMAASVEGFISAEAIAALFHTATTGLLMRVNGTIGAAIGAYESHLSYKQDALLVTLASRA